MKKGLLIVLVLIVGACGSAKLLSPEQRKEIQVLDTSFLKNENYVKALQFFSTRFGDSSKAIKLSDKGAGMIVAKGNTPCNSLKQFGDVNDYSLQFELTVETKDKKIRVAFENLVMITDLGQPVRWSNNQMSSVSNVEKAKECLAPIISSFKASLSEKSDW